MQVLVAHSRELTGAGMDGNIIHTPHTKYRHVPRGPHSSSRAGGDRVIVQWRRALENPIPDTGLWYFMGGAYGGRGERETSADEKPQFRRHFAVYLHEIVVE